MKLTQKTDENRIGIKASEPSSPAVRRRGNSSLMRISAAALAAVGVAAAHCGDEKSLEYSPEYDSDTTINNTYNNGGEVESAKPDASSSEAPPPARPDAVLDFQLRVVTAEGEETLSETMRVN